MTIRFHKTILSSKKLSTEVLIAFGLIFLTILVLLGYLYPGVTSSFFASRHSLPYVIAIGILKRCVSHVAASLSQKTARIDSSRVTHKNKALAVIDAGRDSTL